MPSRCPAFLAFALCATAFAGLPATAFAEMPPFAVPPPSGAATEKPEIRLSVKNVTAWPNLQKLGNGTVVATIFNQPSHGQVEGDVECWGSDDGGLTWRLLGTPARHDPDTNRMNVAVGLARDGDLVMLCSGWSDKPRPGEKSKNAGRFREFILPPWVCRSSDGGLTWSVNKTAFLNEPATPFGDIKIAGNGDLLAVIYKDNTSFVYRSSDDGRTWGNPVEIEAGVNINETALLRLDGTRWLAASRSHLKDNHGLRLYKSGDDGRTWTFVSQVTHGQLYPAHFLRLDDGRVLLAYGNRTGDDKGIDTRLSSDGGETWSEPRRIAAFSGDGGYPASIQRADGRVLTAFYARKSEVSDGYCMASVIWRPEPPAKKP